MSLEVRNKLKSMLCDVTNNESLSESITDSTDLINGIGLDSIQMVNFILMIEDEFEIEFDFENFSIENMQSIGILSDYISDLKLKSAV